MIVKLFGENTLFLQSFLQGAGFNKIKLEGIYGEKTYVAFNAFEVQAEEIASALGKFNFRSEKTSATFIQRRSKPQEYF